MPKPKLCELLGVEPLEEFTYKDYPPMSGIFRIDSEGHVKEKSHCDTWEPLAAQTLLEDMIEKGVIKRLCLSAEQLNCLKVLYTLFRAETLNCDCYGLFIKPAKNMAVRISEFSCLNALFEKSQICINIPEILKRYKEVPNV